MNEIKNEWNKESIKLKELIQKDPAEYILERRRVLDKTLTKLGELPSLKTYVPIEEFALDKSSETFSNLALKGFEKWKDKAPIISIENVTPNMAFSRAEQLRELVKESRKKFVEKAVKEKKLNRKKAEEMAKKLIGVTWDVGHINMLRKYGFKEEEIVKESKKIAPYVKHMHFTDNFGYNDSHLPPGMGNVPFKKIMEQMEKEGYSGKAIMEAAGFVQHFQTSPHLYSLEGLGSPIYSGGPMFMDVGLGGGYFSGYGNFLPEQHFEMYGAGFSNLPLEVGGSTKSKSKFSGTPME